MRAVVQQCHLAAMDCGTQVEDHARWLPPPVPPGKRSAYRPSHRRRPLPPLLLLPLLPL